MRSEGEEEEGEEEEDDDDDKRKVESTCACTELKVYRQCG